MKLHSRLLLILVLAIASIAAAAAASPGHRSGNRMIPVLVHVNAHGRITDVTPAYHLHPAFVRKLHETLQKMITRPAMKHGKPVDSQFVMVLALVDKQQDNGKHVVNIRYQTSKSLPPGQWTWIHQSGHGLALSNQNGQTSSLYTGSWLQKAQRMNNAMGYHATDPLTRE